MPKRDFGLRSKHGGLLFLLPFLTKENFRELKKYLTIIVVALCGMDPLTGAENHESEDKLQSVIAAMITKIAHYTEWPTGGFADKQKVATVAVLSPDKDAFDIFHGVISNKQNGGVIWDVKRVNSFDEAAKYPFVYYDRRYAGPGDQWYEAANDKGVLTFSSGETQRAVFTFVLVDGKVRFDNNMKLAKKSNIVIDPRLLKLARKVDGKEQ